MAIPNKTRRFIWERDARRCGICGVAVDWADLEIDHIEARMDGGGDTAGNLRATHATCNLARGIREAKVRGYSRGRRSPHTMKWDAVLGERAEHEIEWLRGMMDLSRREVVTQAVARWAHTEGFPDERHAPTPPARDAPC